LCVAIAASKNLPTKTQLEDCEDANGDGGGVAWLHEGAVHWKKWVKASAIWEMISEGMVKPPCLIHFRIATTGGVRPELCHPFPVSRKASTATRGTAKQVLIHNGIWHNWSEKVLGSIIKRGGQDQVKGPWSDSRALAWLAFRYGDAVLRLSEQKIATLDNKGSIRIYGRGWELIDGVAYSNKHWNYTGKSWLRRDNRGCFPNSDYTDADYASIKESREEWLEGFFREKEEERKRTGMTLEKDGYTCSYSGTQEIYHPLLDGKKQDSGLSMLQTGDLAKISTKIVRRIQAQSEECVLGEGSIKSSSVEIKQLAS
jgi:hypothetical protein